MVQIGWIGLGQMGSGMAPNLAKKYHHDKPLLLFNRNNAKSQELADSLLKEGVTVAVAPSIAELVQQSDIIFTCLANDAAITQTIDAAVASGDITGKLFVESSTVAPKCTDSLSELLISKGAKFVAAPVFGVPMVAAAGLLTYVLASSNESWIDEVIPFTTGVMGKAYIDLRGKPPGTASTMKLSGNHFILSMVLTLSESMVLASQSGLGEEAIVQFVEAVMGGPYPAYAKRMLSGDYATDEPKFAVDNALKDARHIKDLGDSNGVKLATIEEAIRLLSIVKDQVGAKGDLPVVVGRINIGVWDEWVSSPAAVFILPQQQPQRSPARPTNPPPHPAKPTSKRTSRWANLQPRMPPSGLVYITRGSGVSYSPVAVLKALFLLRIRQAIAKLSTTHTSLSFILYYVAILLNIHHLLRSLRERSIRGLDPDIPQESSRSLCERLWDIISPTMPRPRRKPPEAIKHRLHIIKREITASLYVGFRRISDKMALAISPSAWFAHTDFNGAVGNGNNHNKENAIPNHNPVVGTMQSHPKSSHLYRYFVGLPNPTDLEFKDSIYNMRLEFAPNPPASTRHLNKTMLKDLILGQRNLGKFVVVKTVLLPKHLNNLHVLIEDETGQWGLLHIFEFPYTNHPEDRIGPGQLMIIKEPFYYVGYDTLAAVRVDHPSDIMYVTHKHPQVHEKWKKKDTSGFPVLPKVLKWDAEVRMRWKKYHQALDYLNLALKLAETPKCQEEAKLDILRLRTGAYYYTNHYELSLADANTILANSFNVKAAWYKANCFFKLRRYDECKGLLFKIMQGPSRYKFRDSANMLMQIRAHQDGIVGVFDMKNIIDNCAARKEALMTGDYVSGVKIRKTGIHNLGLFAHQNFKAGDVVMVAKSFASVTGEDNAVFDLRDENAGLVKKKYGPKLLAKMLERMNYEPSGSRLVCKLYNGHRVGDGMKDDKGKIVVDKFYVDELVQKTALQHDSWNRRIQLGCSIVDPDLFPDLNSSPVHGCPLYPHEDGSSDLKIKERYSFWLPTSYINHSCLPNVSRNIFCDMMFITATTDIKIGTELLLNYTDDDYSPLKNRRQDLKDRFGFDCICHLCMFEMDNDEYCASLQKVPEAIHGLAYGILSGHLPSQLDGVRKCIALLHADCMDTPYDFPNFEVVYGLMAEEFLAQRMESESIFDEATTGIEWYFRDMRLALRMIRELRGEYLIENGVFKILRLGFLCKWLFEAYMLAAVAMANFHGDMKRFLQEVAGDIYGMLCGENITFSKVSTRRLKDKVGDKPEAEYLDAGVMVEWLVDQGLERSELAC
ncbi:hypothetical protein H072_903 [Dactylellina haptotyla CBS 200.50]|uniref:SET domain-containing protein n=1 Tax=Dactylellina haptotyla (strain CBS 200.50) TaxID=1284197 RepID=S8AQG0_DACHA|nr:hypothetical protein H072_903 [Dactylellina haptotyla CBS 200.50]